MEFIRGGNDNAVRFFRVEHCIKIVVHRHFFPYFLLKEFRAGFIDIVHARKRYRILVSLGKRANEQHITAKTCADDYVSLFHVSLQDLEFF